MRAQFAQLGLQAVVEDNDDQETSVDQQVDSYEARKDAEDAEAQGQTTKLKVTLTALVERIDPETIPPARVEPSKLFVHGVEWGHREHIKDNIRDNANQADRGFFDFIAASMAFPYLDNRERWLLSEWKLERYFYRANEEDDTKQVSDLKAKSNVFKAYQAAGKLFPAQPNDDTRYGLEYAVLSDREYTAKKYGAFDLRVLQQQVRLEEFRQWKSEKRGKDKSKSPGGETRRPIQHDFSQAAAQQIDTALRNLHVPVSSDERRKMRLEVPEILDSQKYHEADYVNERVLTVFSFFRLWSGPGINVEDLLAKLYAGLFFLQRRAQNQPDNGSSYDSWLNAEMALRLVRTWVYEIPFWMRCVYTVQQTYADRKDKDEDRVVLERLYVIMKERQMERLVYYSSRYGSNLFYTHRSEENRENNADSVPTLTTNWLAALRYEMKVLAAIPSQAGDFPPDHAAFFRTNSRLDLDESVFRSVRRIAEWSSIGLPYWIALKTSEEKDGDGGTLLDVLNRPKDQTIEVDSVDIPVLMKWRELLGQRLVEWQTTKNPDDEVHELVDVYALFQESDRLTAYRELSEKLRDFLNNQLLDLETQLYGENKEQSKSRKNLRVTFEQEVVKIIEHSKQKPRPDEAEKEKLSSQLSNALLHNRIFDSIPLPKGEDLANFRPRLVKLLWTAQSAQENAELQRLMAIANRAIQPFQKSLPRHWGNFQRLKEQLPLRNAPTRRELDEQRRLLLRQARQRLEAIERDESSVLSRLAWHPDDTRTQFAFRSTLLKEARDKAGLTEEELTTMTPDTGRGSLYDAVRIYEDAKRNTSGRLSDVYEDLSGRYSVNAEARLVRNMTQLAHLRSLMDRVDSDTKGSALTSRKWMRRYTESQPPWLLLDEDDAKQRIRTAREEIKEPQELERRLAFEPLNEDAVLSHYVETLRAFDMSVYVAGMFTDLTDAVATMMDLLGEEGGENINLRLSEKTQKKQDANTPGKILWDYAANTLPAERRPDEQYTAYVRDQLEENLVRVMNWLATAQEVKSNLIECVLPYLDKLFERDREERRLAEASTDMEDLSNADIQRVAAASTRRGFVRETYREEEVKDESDDEDSGEDEMPPPLDIKAVLSDLASKRNAYEEKRSDEKKIEVVVNIDNLTINNNPRRLKVPAWREQELQQDDSGGEEQPDDEKKDGSDDDRRYPKRQIAPPPLRTVDDVQQGAAATRRNYRRSNIVQEEEQPEDSAPTDEPIENKYDEPEPDETQEVDDAETEPEEEPDMTQFTVPPEEGEEEEEEPQEEDDEGATYDPVSPPYSPDVVDLTNEADDVHPGDVINLTVTDEGDEMDVIDRDLVRSVKRKVEWLITDSDDSQDDPQPEESSKKLRTGAHLEVVADDADSETEEPAATVTQSWLWMADLYVEIGYSCFSTPAMQDTTQLMGLVDANSPCGVQLQYICTVLQNLSEELGGLLLVAMRSDDAQLTMSQAALTVKVQYHWLMQLVHHHIHHEVKKMLKHLHYRDKMENSWPDKYSITKRIATSHHIGRVTEHVQSLMSDPPLQPETSAYKTYRRDEVMRMLDVVLRVLGQYPPPDLSDMAVIELEKRLVWAQDLLKTTFAQDEYIHGALWRMVVVNADGWLSALAPILPPLPGDDAPTEDGPQTPDEDDSAPVDDGGQTDDADVGAGKQLTTSDAEKTGPPAGDTTLTLQHSFRGKLAGKTATVKLQVAAGRKISKAYTDKNQMMAREKQIAPTTAAGKRLKQRPGVRVVRKVPKGKPKTGAGEAMTGKADIEDDTVYELWRLMKDIATKEIASEKTPATGAGEAVKRKQPDQAQPSNDDAARETIAVYRRLVLDEYKACLGMLLQIQTRLLPLWQRAELLLEWNSQLASSDLLVEANKKMQQTLASLHSINWMVRRVYFQLLRDQETQQDGPSQPRTGADLSASIENRALNSLETQSTPTFSENIDGLPRLITPRRSELSEVEKINAQLDSMLDAELWNSQQGMRRLGRLAQADYRLVQEVEETDTEVALQRMMTLSRVVAYRTVAIERLGTAIFSADWLEAPPSTAQVGAGRFFTERAEEVEIGGDDPIDAIDLVSSDDDENEVAEEIADIKQRLQAVKQNGELIDLTLAIEQEEEKQSEKVVPDPGGWRTKLRSRRFEPREEERRVDIPPPDSREPLEVARQIASFASNVPFPGVEEVDNDEKQAKPGAGGMKRGRDRDDDDDSDKRWRPDEDYDPEVDSVPISDEFCERESLYLEQSGAVLNIWKDAAEKMHNAHGPALLLVDKRTGRLLRMGYFWHGMPMRHTGFGHAYYSHWTDGERSLRRKVWSHPDLPFVIQESSAGGGSITKVRVRLDANRQPTHELLKGPPPGMIGYESFFSDRFNDAEFSTDAADVKEAEQQWNRAVVAREQDIARAKLKRRRDGNDPDDIDMLADKLSRTGAGEAVKRRANGFDLDDPDSYQHKRVVFTGVYPLDVEATVTTLNKNNQLHSTTEPAIVRKAYNWNFNYDDDEEKGLPARTTTKSETWYDKGVERRNDAGPTYTDYRDNGPAYREWRKEGLPTIVHDNNHTLLRGQWNAYYVNPPTNSNDTLYTSRRLATIYDQNGNDNPMATPDTIDRVAHEWNSWAQDQHEQRAVAIADTTGLPLDVAKVVNDQAGPPEIPFPDQYHTLQAQQAAERQQNAQRNQARLEQLSMDRVLAMLDPSSGIAPPKLQREGGEEEVAALPVVRRRPVPVETDLPGGARQQMQNVSQYWQDKDAANQTRTRFRQNVLGQPPPPIRDSWVPTYGEDESTALRTQFRRDQLGEQALTSSWVDSVHPASIQPTVGAGRQLEVKGGRISRPHVRKAARRVTNVAKDVMKEAVKESVKKHVINQYSELQRERGKFKRGSGIFYSAKNKRQFD
jgi:hypothetical protein